ncbi:hypothetical protein GOP47_0022991 [Adiantum capillus-veneris]|uniref:Uncharacterized protein n=1 Tax=Adiantum capillus-veneris TaxID=13818 RepID=A0A9D4Z6I6_ADICA|nr:hypothetical protein GOP47_0022991 [Adiantum capillus-veneris]
MECREQAEDIEKIKSLKFTGCLTSRNHLRAVGGLRFEDGYIGESKEQSEVDGVDESATVGEHGRGVNLEPNPLGCSF